MTTGETKVRSSGINHGRRMANPNQRSVSDFVKPYHQQHQPKQHHTMVTCGREWDDDSSNRTASTRSSSTTDGSCSNHSSVTITRGYDGSDCVRDVVVEDEEEAEEEITPYPSSPVHRIRLSKHRQQQQRQQQQQSNGQHLPTVVLSKDKGRKRVRFASPVGSTVGTIPCLSDVSAEERWDTWWCPHEYQAIRLAAKYTTKQIRKCDTLSAECVQRTFSYAVHVSNDSADETEHGHFRMGLEGMTHGDEEEGFDSACSLLESWCTSTLPTRGLEKYVSQQHKKDRMELMNATRRVVSELSSVPSDSWSSTIYESKEEEIAHVYGQYSKFAHLFARFMGQADARAAEQGAGEMPGERMSLTMMTTTTNTPSSSSSSKTPTSVAEQQRRSIRKLNMVQRSASLDHSAPSMMHREDCHPVMATAAKSRSPANGMVLNTSACAVSAASVQQQRRRRNSVHGVLSSVLGGSANNKNMISPKMNNTAVLLDESVKASINTTSNSLSSSSRHRGVDSSNSNSGKTHLQRSFSKRSLLRRSSSQRQPNSSDEPLSSSLHMPQGPGMSLLQRSDSRRAHLVPRQDSFHYQPPKLLEASSSSPSSNAASPTNNSNGANLVLSNSRRSSMQQHRQESMKRHKTNSMTTMHNSSSSHGGDTTTGVVPNHGSRRSSFTSACSARRLMGLGERQSSVPNVNSLGNTGNSTTPTTTSNKKTPVSGSLRRSSSNETSSSRPQHKLFPEQ